MQKLENAFSAQIDLLYSPQAWKTNPKGVVKDTANLLSISEGFQRKVLYPPHAEILQKIVLICKKSKILPSENQRTLLRIAKEKIDGMLPKDHCSSGDAEIPLTIVDRQLELFNKGITSIKAVEPNGPSIDVSSKEGFCRSIQTLGWSILAIDRRFEQDEKYGLEALSCSLVAAAFFDKNLYSHDFFHKAAHINGLALYFFPDGAKDTPCIVGAAVVQNIRAFQFASRQAQICRGVAIEAGLRDKSTIERVDPELKKDIETLRIALVVLQYSSPF